MTIMNSWGGAGRSYLHPSAVRKTNAGNLDVNERSRYGQAPFRKFVAGAAAVMSKGGQNTGDPRVQWGESWGANSTKSAALDNNVRTH